MRVRLLGALFAGVMLVSGCGAAESTGDAEATRSFTADNGKVDIPQEPKRIVATGYAVPTLLETDAPLVGISSWKRGEPTMSKDEKAEYDKIKRIAGELATETDYEAIANAKPDLIIIGVPKPIASQVDLKRLKSIAPTITLGPMVPAEWRKVSEQTADAAGRKAEYDEIKKAYNDKAAELKDKYASALKDLKFGHVGAYGDVSAGTFQREFGGSWGTSIAEDIGVQYYGKVKKPGKGSAAVSETPSTEEITSSLGKADAITYSLAPDGSDAPSVKQVLKSPLWKKLPAVKDKKTFALSDTEAATYGSAQRTLDGLDKVLKPLLGRG